MSNENIPEITIENLSKWINHAKIQGISPNALIISHPGSSTMKIGDKKIFVNAQPLIHSVMGIRSQRLAFLE